MSARMPLHPRLSLSPKRLSLRGPQSLASERRPWRALPRRRAPRRPAGCASAAFAQRPLPFRAAGTAAARCECSLWAGLASTWPRTPAQSPVAATAESAD
eukprot:Amastigsp_a680959_4.p3 type:complete len:100 gc:universal Amastigsp_a680959_4:93-392(+)